MFNKTPTLTSAFTATQHDFVFDTGFILHVTADDPEIATARFEYFMNRLREEEAKGKAEAFLYPHDAMKVPLGFFLRNRAAQDVSCWLTRFGR